MTNHDACKTKSNYYNFRLLTRSPFHEAVYDNLMHFFCVFIFLFFFFFFFFFSFFDKKTESNGIHMLLDIMSSLKMRGL